MSKSLQEQLDDFQIAWQDLWFEIATTLRIPALVAKLGMVERQWFVDARERKAQRR